MGMSSMQKRGMGALAGVALLLVLAPGTAVAAGGFKGRFGGTSFKAIKLGISCAYVGGFFQVFGPSKPKIHLRSRSADIKFAQIGGAGADPTAPGAVFPIQLTNTEVLFVNARGVGIGTDPKSIPGWVATGSDGFVVTITGFKKGKVVGTFSGTLQPGESNPNPAIQASGSFAATCLVQ